MSPREGPGAGETPCAQLGDAAGFCSERGPWLRAPSQPLSTEVKILRLAEQGPPEDPALPRGQDRCPRAPILSHRLQQEAVCPLSRKPCLQDTLAGTGLANGGPRAWSRKVLQTMGAQPCPSFTLCSWLLLWRRDRAEWLSQRTCGPQSLKQSLSGPLHLPSSALERKIGVTQRAAQGSR